ncbi:MAG TPA: T9SS type A sorting domain-containing protein [Patescibacteria group bacterium]|nr:T9SS type A sorting domain-containing protein [Patescibacteria group bacterium]
MMKFHIFFSLLFCIATLPASSQKYAAFDKKSVEVQSNDTLQIFITVFPNQLISDVQLSVNSQTLDISLLNLDSPIAKPPLPTKKLLTYVVSPLESGIHTIKLKATYANSFTYDTLFVHINKTDSVWSRIKELGINSKLFSSRANTIYAVTPEFINTYHDGAIKNIRTSANYPNYIRPLAFDSADNIWSFSPAFLENYNGKDWRLIPHQISAPVKEMLVDKNETVWLLTEYTSPVVNHRLYSFKKDAIIRHDSIRYYFPEQTGQFDRMSLYDITLDREKNLYLLAAKHDAAQLVLLKSEGNKWKNIDFPKPWLRINVERWKESLYITSDRSKSLAIWYEAVDSSLQYINGFLKYEDSKWNNYPSTTDFRIKKHSEILSDSKGNIWFISDNPQKLICFNGTDYLEISEFNSPLLKNTPTSFTIDTNDNLWLVCDSIIIMYNPNGLRGIKTSINNYPVEEKHTYSTMSLLSYPNPASHYVKINYFLSNESKVSLTIYNSLGVEVFKNNLGFKNAGDNNEIIFTSDLPSGQYYYVLKAGAQQSTQPLVIMR